MYTNDSIPPHHRYSHFAMATEFALYVAEEQAKDARAVAVEVFQEIDRLEQDLSRFEEGSDVCRINHARPGKRLRISPETFACLQGALDVKQWTDGAFDVTYASNTNGTDPINKLLSLDVDGLSATVNTKGVQVDLGGIGKGFALDHVRSILEDWGITRCLIQGGGSSILALDPPKGHPGWPVGVGLVEQRTIVPLCRQAIGASGTEVKGEHIVNLRNTQSSPSNRKTWAFAPEAMVADALSTAFMVMPLEDVESLCNQNQNIEAMIDLGKECCGNKDRWLRLGTELVP